MIFVQIIQRRLQRAFDLRHRQRLADHPGGERQYRALVNTAQCGQRGTGAAGVGQPLGTGAGVGVAGIGQQVTHVALQTLTGQQHRRRAKGVGGSHAGNLRPFGQAHDHYILAPRTLDARRSNAKLKTGNRVQGRQRTKTNSHESAPCRHR